MFNRLKSFLNLNQSTASAADTSVPTATPNSSPQPQPTTNPQPIKLCLTLEEVELPATLAGKSIEELVNEYAEELGCEPHQVKSYRVVRPEGSKLVTRDYRVEAGDTIRLAITSESKN